jgi:hypothetical protein
MRKLLLLAAVLAVGADPPPGPLVVKPDAFKTLVNPQCSHCRDEARRRAGELKDDDRVLCWIRGYSDGGAIPLRFFLNPYRVISDTYGVFVYDPDAGYARAFAPSLDFSFYGWRNGVMVMRHKDGTLYSCLSGLAFDGPGKGKRLEPVPALVSDWGFWLKRYPGAVAYHMFEKYRAVELPDKVNEDSRKSRSSRTDDRLAADSLVLGVTHGKDARAYPLEALTKAGIVREDVGGKSWVVLWHGPTRTAAAYLSMASPPKKEAGNPRPVTLDVDAKGGETPFIDKETGSHWDIAGRAVAGQLQGWTLSWRDGMQVRWFAWSAEYPDTSVYGQRASGSGVKQPRGKARAIAGEAEFLRSIPKHFATLKAVDAARGLVTLLIEGESLPKVWQLVPDAEVKVLGWWGRLEQLRSGDRVWVWFKTDRRQQPVAVCMIADEPSEQDLHGPGVTIEAVPAGGLSLLPAKGAKRLLQRAGAEVYRGAAKAAPETLRAGERVYVQSAGGAARVVLDPEAFEARRGEQKAALRQRWAREGLPGTATFVHVFSGEMELMLDHEAMRWGRSLEPGNQVRLQADPPIQAVVQQVRPWRERTLLRLVVHGQDLADLIVGQRLRLRIAPPSAAVDESTLPPDLNRPRSKEDRIEWFLASTYCTCGIGGDGCTGHFYTLASCNPNGCASPNHARQVLAQRIDKGLTDRQIFEQLLADQGPLLLRPHLRP